MVSAMQRQHNPNPRYIVEGHLHADVDSDFAPDGNFAPFYVFDSDAQLHVAGPFASRKAAEAWGAV